MNWHGGIIQRRNQRTPVLVSAQFSRMPLKLTSAFAGLRHDLLSDCHEIDRLIQPVLLLAAAALCFFKFALHQQSETFHPFMTAVFAAAMAADILHCRLLWHVTAVRNL